MALQLRRQYLELHKLQKLQNMLNFLRVEKGGFGIPLSLCFENFKHGQIISIAAFTGTAR